MLVYQAALIACSCKSDEKHNSITFCSICCQRTDALKLYAL